MGCLKKRPCFAGRTNEIRGRVDMHDKKVLCTFFLIAPFMIGCRSIYMSAEERNQGAIIAEDSVTLNEASEMDKMLW